MSSANFSIHGQFAASGMNCCLECVGVCEKAHKYIQTASSGLTLPRGVLLIEGMVVS